MFSKCVMFCRRISVPACSGSSSTAIKCLHGFGRGLCLKRTWLFRERVHTLTCWLCRGFLQLQVQGPTKLESPILLDLFRNEPDVSFHCTLHIFSLHTCGLRHCAVCSGRRHGFR